MKNPEKGATYFFRISKNLYKPMMEDFALVSEDSPGLDLQKRKIGADYRLKDGDVVEIMFKT